MKEKQFLNLSSEIPKLSKNEADQLKGGFKKVATKPSVQMSGDINKNCHGNSGDAGSDEDGDANVNCKFSCKCNS